MKDEKFFVQEKVKNSWELARGLAVFGALVMAAALASIERAVEQNNTVLLWLVFMGLILGACAIIFLIVTYLTSLRLINKLKEEENDRI